MEDDYGPWGFDSRGVRAGQRRTAEGEHAEPIFTTSSFVFENAAQAAARFGETEAGNIYSRFTNPTVETFAVRLAALEGGEACMPTASGMAAILSCCMAFLKAGDHVLCSRSVFGATVSLFTKYLSRFGVETTFVDLVDPVAWEAALRPTTRLFYLETPSNPLTEVADIRQLAEIARAHGCRLVVDNCFCTPALQRPLALGAHGVIHSATKYLDGQGRCVGGAVVGSREDMDAVRAFVRTAGPCMSPFNAWVFLKGLETLSLRMKAHCANAHALALWLKEQPAVTSVHYPGLVDHPQHSLAASQQLAFGGIVSFELAGGREAAWRLIDATQMVSITGNLGDVKTTITHPASTTHGRLTDAERAAAGITEGLIRLSVGVEDIEDLQADLARGLGR